MHGPLPSSSSSTSFFERLSRFVFDPLLDLAMEGTSSEGGSRGGGVRQPISQYQQHYSPPNSQPVASTTHPHQVVSPSDIKKRTNIEVGGGYPILHQQRQWRREHAERRRVDEQPLGGPNIVDAASRNFSTQRKEVFAGGSAPRLHTSSSLDLDTTRGDHHASCGAQPLEIAIGGAAQDKRKSYSLQPQYSTTNSTTGSLVLMIEPEDDDEGKEDVLNLTDGSSNSGRVVEKSGSMSTISPPGPSTSSTNPTTTAEGGGKGITREISTTYSTPIHVAVDVGEAKPKVAGKTPSSPQPMHESFHNNDNINEGTSKEKKRRRMKWELARSVSDEVDDEVYEDQRSRHSSYSLSSSLPKTSPTSAGSSTTTPSSAGGGPPGGGADFLVAVDICAAVAHGHLAKLRWIDNRSAKNSVLTALSIFYAMVISIFALVFELAHLLTGDNRRNVGVKDLLFGIYMYGAAILFLLYCYAVLLLNPRWKVSLAKAGRTFSTIRRSTVTSNSSSKSLQASTIATSSEASISVASIPRKVSHDSPAAGSLFLRLGCVVFGVIGTVFYAFSLFLCASDGECDHWIILLDAMAITFVFIQMHFIFCNWKLSITGAQRIARFGIMHLVATNLWTWTRYILIEECAMNEEIRHVFTRDTAHVAGAMGAHLQGATSSAMTTTTTTTSTMLPTGSALRTGVSPKLSKQCEGADCVLASMSAVMYTSIVEYSLIGAAVMFIVWRNIDQDRQLVAAAHKQQPNSSYVFSTTNSTPTINRGVLSKESSITSSYTTTYVKRKHQIRMDCSKSSTGLFVGLAFLAATFTSMAVFSGYSLIGESHHAAVVFGATDIALYVVASFGSLIALWQMRKLRYHSVSQTVMLGGGSHVPTASPSTTSSSSIQTVDVTAPVPISTSSVSSIGNGSRIGYGGGSGSRPSQELLDMILLALGMSGELIYSVAGLLGLTGDLTDRKWHPISVMLLVVHVTRITEVGLQSCLIYIAGKLRIQGDAQLRRTQPGKQAITFLLLANISMFLMNLLEAEKAGISESVVNFYGKKSWVFLVRSFSPLTIFYRFHSSVCLAEVWKNAYAWKENLQQPQQQ